MKTIYMKGSVIALLMGVSLASQSQIINTIAGNGTAAYSGDGGQATAAELNSPFGILNTGGNSYVADASNNRIRMINSSGTINTFAGNGVAGFSGDGGQASVAELKSPTGIAMDANGNFYIADAINNRVRMVNTTGIISTFAGKGAPSYSGDGGAATAAGLNFPSGVAVDMTGNVLIADANNSCIRLVNTSGIINTIAGNGISGFSGDGGAATAAELNSCSGVALDAAGNIYIADQVNNRIRMVNTSGIINTVAGNGIGSYSGDGGQATAAELNFPYGIAVDAANNILIADANNNRIRIITTSGVISTYAGSGAPGFSGDGGQATVAELNGVSSVSLDAAGNIYLGDTYNNRVRKMDGLGISATANTHEKCKGENMGSASATATGGTLPYSYTWAPSGGTNATASGLTAGTYTITVKDLYSVLSTATVTITQPAALSLFQYYNPDTAWVGPCTGSSWISVTGGTKAYSYLWSPGGATTDTLNGVCIGTYCCHVMDANGCMDSICENITGIEKINEAANIHVYPDPTNGSYSVTGVKQGQIIELYNYMGQIISSTVVDNSTMDFDISSNANGIYLLRILNKDGNIVTVKKMLKTE